MNSKYANCCREPDCIAYSEFAKKEDEIIDPKSALSWGNTWERKIYEELGECSKG